MRGTPHPLIAGTAAIAASALAVALTLWARYERQRRLLRFLGRA